MALSPRDIERVFRAEYARAVTVLVRAFGDIDAAEEEVQDAFTVALRSWPSAGLPPSPAGGIITTAKNRTIDRRRREATRADRHEHATLLHAPGEPAEEQAPVRDNLLRLIFTCCHPALSPQARVALTLRLLGGLTTAEIARAFLVPEVTMAQRLVRAKGKSRDAGIPFRVPEEPELRGRVKAVLEVVYLTSTRATATSGEHLVREDLCAEALRLGRLLAELLPEESEVLGLLALMLLVDSRREARAHTRGELILLAEQDRTRWNRALIAEGQALVRECLRRNQPEPYQLQAAIQAVHSDADTAAATDWRQVVQLYDHLLALAPGPIAALNRAVAVAEVEGAQKALALVEPLRPALDGYPVFHAVRADLLRRLGRNAEARDAYGAALSRTGNAAEQAFLLRRQGELAAKDLTPVM